MSYTTTNYGWMIRDTPRIEAFLGAIRAAVKPGDKVLDLGTGTGIAAFAAVQAGASHVLAIEPNSSIQVARDIARDNGMQDKITFVQALSQDVEVEEEVDVIICDLRGRLPFNENSLASIIDARDRWLKDDGRMVGIRDELFVAPVERPKAWNYVIGHWTDNPVGLDMSAAARVSGNSWYNWEMRPEHLLSKPAELGVLDYRAMTDKNFVSDVTFEVQKAGVIHGFAVWFRVWTDEEHSFETGPEFPKTVYGNPFFPLLEPIDVQAGETVSLHWEARNIAGSYTFTWRGGTPTHRFDLSTFFGAELSTTQLVKERPDYKPERNKDAEHQLFLLDRMDGESSLIDLARSLHEGFPEDFQSIPETLRWVKSITRRMGR